MRRSKLGCAVMAGGIALGACSPSEEPSPAPPAPGTPPPGWEASGPGSDTAPNPDADRVFTQQVRASQERVVTLSEIAADKGSPRLRAPAQQMRERATGYLQQVSGVVEAAPEDAQVEKTEGLPSSAELARIAKLDGEVFHERWVSEMRNLQQFTLQLANNQVDLGQHDPGQRWSGLAQRMSTETQTALARLNSLP